MKCVNCGKTLGPVDAVMSTTCGPCAREKHREVTGSSRTTKNREMTMKKKTETTTAVVTDRQAEARDWRAMDLFQHTLEREITDGRKDVRDRLEYVQRRIAEALDRLTKDGSCWTGFIAAVGDLDQAATLLRENISRANALKSALLHDERKQAEQDAVRANLTAIIMKSGGAS